MANAPAPRAPQLVDRLAAPFLRFLAIEAASTILLLLADDRGARLGELALARELRGASGTCRSASRSAGASCRSRSSTG